MCEIYNSQGGREAMLVYTIQIPKFYEHIFSFIGLKTLRTIF